MGKKPTKIKKLEGTYRKDRVAKNEMMPEVLNEVGKPKGLINNYSDEIWLKVTRELSSLNMLHSVDQEMLMAYCNEMGIYFDCCEKTKAVGSYTEENKANGKIISNFMKVGNTALNNAIKLSDKFGFNPAARTKIEMPQQKPNDPLADF